MLIEERAVARAPDLKNAAARAGECNFTVVSAGDERADIVVENLVVGLCAGKLERCLPTAMDGDQRRLAVSEWQ